MVGSGPTTTAGKRWWAGVGAPDPDAPAPLDRRRLRQLPGAVRHLAGGECRRSRGGHRPQRRRQDHADAGDLRPDPADARQHAHGGHRPCGNAGTPHRRTRDRARAGKPPPVRAHDGRGQSAHGRLHPDGAIQIPRAARFRLSAVPPPARAAPPIGGNHVGRRAADVCDRPRADVRAQAAAARRTVRRPGPRHRAAGVRARAPHSGERPHRAHRRTECAPGPARGGPRLSAGSRQSSRHPEQPANCWKVPRSAKPTWESEACSTSSTSTCWRR